MELQLEYAVPELQLHDIKKCGWNMLCYVHFKVHHPCHRGTSEWVWSTCYIYHQLFQHGEEVQKGRELRK